MEEEAKRLLRQGSLQRFHEFILENAQRLCVDHEFEEEQRATLLICLLQTYSKSRAIQSSARVTSTASASNDVIPVDSESPHQQHEQQRDETAASNDVISMYEQCVRSLVARCGARVNTADVRGRSPGHWAVLLHTPGLLRLLLELGLEPGLQDCEGQTIAHLAVRLGCATCLEVIMQACQTAHHSDGATESDACEDDAIVLSAHSSISGATPLIYAVQIGANDIARKLLQLGVDPNIAERNRHGRTALHFAMMQANEAVFELLLKYGARPDVPDSKGRTVTQRLLQRPQDTLMKLMLRYFAAEMMMAASTTASSTGVSAAAGNGGVTSPLMLACQLDNLDLVHKCLSENAASMTQRDHADRTCLHYCAENRGDECARAVIRAAGRGSGFARALINSQDCKGFTALHLAVIAHSTPLIRLLLSEGEENGEADLHQNNERKVEKRMCGGADLHLVDQDRHTCLHWAVVCRCPLEIVETLLFNDAECVSTCSSTPDAPPQFLCAMADCHGAIPLHYVTQTFCPTATTTSSRPQSSSGAASHCTPPIFNEAASTQQHEHESENEIENTEQHVQLAIDTTKLLLRVMTEKDAALIDHADLEMRTPLLWAASIGATQCCDLMLLAGARMLHADASGLTALHCAASQGHQALVQLLIDKWRFPLNLTDGQGCTALFYACSLNNIPIVHTLLTFQSDKQAADVATDETVQASANVNHTDKKGRTVAHCAASKGHTDMLEVLCQYGCRLVGQTELSEKFCNTPLHEAALGGYTDTVERLLELMLIECDENSEKWAIAVHHRNGEGRTALHEAASKNNGDVCTVILNKYSQIMCDANDVAATNLVNALTSNLSAENQWEEKTALDLAENDHCIRVLLGFGALPANELTNCHKVDHNLGNSHNMGDGDSNSHNSVLVNIEAHDEPKVTSNSKTYGNFNETNDDESDHIKSGNSLRTSDQNGSYDNFNSVEKSIDEEVDKPSSKEIEKLSTSPVLNRDTRQSDQIQQKNGNSNSSTKVKSPNLKLGKKLPEKKSTNHNKMASRIINSVREYEGTRKSLQNWQHNRRLLYNNYAQLLNEQSNQKMENKRIDPCIKPETILDTDILVNEDSFKNMSNKSKPYYRKKENSMISSARSLPLITQKPIVEVSCNNATNLSNEASIISSNVSSNEKKPISSKYLISKSATFVTALIYPNKKISLSQHRIMNLYKAYGYPKSKKDINMRDTQ